MRSRLTNLPKRRLVHAALLAMLLALLVAAPYLDVTTGGLLPNELSSPGSLQVLAVVLTVAALAVSFDLLIGYTGLVSFGHALFFAMGAYGFALMLRHTEASFATCVGVAIGVTVTGAIVVNAVALRASFIAFSMVTLAFAQLASILVNRNFFGLGGEEGVTLPYQRLPKVFVGVVNTRYTYWVALGLLVLVYLVVAWVTSTRLGRVWQAIRENELRVSVMGFNVYGYKLLSAVVGSTLAGLAGIVYAIVLGTADPGVTGLLYSLGLIVMVVLGGRGRVWGAALGGALYALMELRLPVLAASDAVAGLPKALRIPLSEPQLLLGIIFIAFIFAMPGGLAELVSRLGGRRAGGGSATPGAAAPASPPSPTSPPSRAPAQQST